MVASAMSGLTPQFVGLAPWPPGVEVVECVTPQRRYDLHNSCTIHETAVTCGPRLELWIRLVEDATGEMLGLGFVGVQGLTFRQDDRASAPAAWRPHEVETFLGVEYVPDGDGSPRFTVETIVGTYAFTCGEVRFHHGVT